MFDESVGLWKTVDPAEAEKMLVVHGTSHSSANNIMRRFGTMVPKGNRGYLHFSHATSSMTLDQMDQLRLGTAYLILHTKRVNEEFEVWMNPVGTVTLRKKGRLVQSRSRNYFQYALNRRELALHLCGYEG